MESEKRGAKVHSSSYARKSILTVFFVVIITLLLTAESQARPDRHGETLCDHPDFHCITAGYSIKEKKIKTRKGTKIREIKVKDTWKRLWPDEREREIVMRVNRLNLRLRKDMVIAVPNNMDGKTYMDYSPFPKNMDKDCEPQAEPVCRIKCENCGEVETVELVFKKVCEQPCIPKQELSCGPDGFAVGAKLIVIDLSLLAFAAYDEYGTLLRWGPVSGGKNWGRWIPKRHLTVVGNFRISRKFGRWAKSGIYPLAKGDKPAGGAPVPYFMRFRRGYGLHYYHEVPGYHASHGCVRLFFDDAKWLNRNFAEIGTRVLVKPYE